MLNLTVFTPAPGDRTAHLPVLVWIHGGGYVAGCQNSSWYDGATFNADGIVTVSIGYRLGAQAWLRLAGAPDNRGALDWIAALTWVAMNIEAFGGDPAAVTIAGQSAGGGVVLDLLAMPAAAGLFIRAMAISAALGNESAAASDAVAARFERFSGRPATVRDADSFDAEQLHDLTEQLNSGDSGRPEVAVAPFADGVVLPQPVLTALRAGASAGIPLLLGTTHDEFSTAGAGVPDDLPGPALVAALVGLGVPEPEAVARVAAHTGRPGALVGQAVTDAMFRGLARAVATVRSDGPAPTWPYQFDRPAAAPASGGLAGHCLDLPFWWHRPDGERVHDATGDGAPVALADAMHGAMVRFVRGEDPGWAPFDAVRRSTMTWADPPDPCGDPFADVVGGGPPPVRSPR